MKDNMDASFIGCNLKDTLVKKMVTFEEEWGKTCGHNPLNYLLPTCMHWSTRVPIMKNPSSLPGFKTPYRPVHTPVALLTMLCSHTFAPTHVCYKLNKNKTLCEVKYW